MKEPLWLERSWVDAIHYQQLTRFGGLFGVRDEGAVESALARARNQWEYAEERDIAHLAAAYGFGLTRSHGYSDGNKRVGFVSMAVFLDLNGWTIEAPEFDIVEIMLGVAAGEVDETQLADWVRAHLKPLVTSSDA
ncbi:MAG TPA: type II toxin-antitoxin system death-on-curing family toxin [Longimicrobium sp.]|nr:type II toxin-antitoxin system death-on-curing family toxin [Longimicrobium sp.]